MKAMKLPLSQKLIENDENHTSSEKNDATLNNDSASTPVEGEEPPVS